MLFVKSFVIGLGKIIPGVSGALLAINFGIYERFIDTLINFFTNWRKNIQFLFIVSLGGITGIVLGSKILLLLFNSYQFFTMMFFIGLIIGGSYTFSKKIIYTKKSLFTILISILLFYVLLFNNIQFKGVFNTNWMLILGGFIEVFASIVPGISATSLLMILGLYDSVLLMVGNINDTSYVINNFNNYLYFGLGMMISFIFNVYLIKYLLSKHQNMTNCVILGLSIASTLYLLFEMLSLTFNFLTLLGGILLLILGLGANKYLNKV